MRIHYIAQIATAILPSLLFSDHAHAIDLDINSADTIKAAAKHTIQGMWGYYLGNNTGQAPGAFEFSWWEGAALCNALLNYWHFTGDDYYNEALSQALQWQGGDSGDFLNENFTTYAGNDDQMQWGSAAMAAAEYNLPDRPTGFGWASLVIGVYNNQKDSNNGWDADTCGGGFRWQKLPIQGGGYTMKNSVSNGGFFQIAARLANYLQEDEYAQWAEKTWNWSTKVGLVNTETWVVQDSVDSKDGCKKPGRTQWTYNYGVYFNGCAYMYAYTNDTIWLDRLNGLLDATYKLFFLPKNNNAISEVTCEAVGNVCDRNQQLFKGLTVMWMANVALLVPSTYDKILSMLQSSAEGAAKSCTGWGNSTCGVRWYGGYDDKIGMEEQISAANVFSVAMLPFVNHSSSGPSTTLTGGNSSAVADTGAGKDDSGVPNYAPITTADKAGAGILTVVFTSGMVGMAVFMLMGP